MNNRFEALSCPTCNAAIGINEKKCPYCGRELLLVVDNSEIDQFEEAVKLLKGKKPFLCNRAQVDHIINLLEEAYETNPGAIIDYLRAYVEYDYFKRKFLNRTPDYMFYYNRAISGGLTQNNIKELENKIGVTISFGG